MTTPERIDHTELYEFFDSTMDRAMDGEVFVILHPLRPEMILMRKDKLGVFEKAIEDALTKAA